MKPSSWSSRFPLVARILVAMTLGVVLGLIGRGSGPVGGVAAVTASGLGRLGMAVVDLIFIQAMQSRSGLMLVG